MPVKKQKPLPKPNMDEDRNFVISASGTDSISMSDDIILDLGTGGPALQLDDVQTITLDELNMTSTITLPTSSYTIAGGGGTSGIGNIYNVGTSYNWTNTVSTTPTVNITSDGVNIAPGADLKIGNVSLKEFISKMEQRLSILVPDPEKLEKFEALKKAYEHYKTMESLCFPEEKEEKE